tara:strand:- start:1868 stop:2119 length:252 start_codon:yes stop_codon:yes gene_type:complete
MSTTNRLKEELLEKISNVPSDQSDEDEFEMDEEGMDMSDLLQTFFTDSKKNRNVCDILVEIKRQFEVQNKLLLQICETLSPKK